MHSSQYGNDINSPEVLISKKQLPSVDNATKSPRKQEFEELKQQRDELVHALKSILSEVDGIEDAYITYAEKRITLKAKKALLKAGA